MSFVTDGSTVNRFVAKTPAVVDDSGYPWTGRAFTSERKMPPQAPDLLRRADTQKRLDQSIGLLTISQEDYRNMGYSFPVSLPGGVRTDGDAERCGNSGRPQTGFDKGPTTALPTG